MESLSRSELEIMQVLWASPVSLSAQQIVAQSSDASWKSNSVHILLNNLLRKAAIAVDGYAQAGKHYSRTFRPQFSRAAYAAFQVRDVTATHAADLADETKDVICALLKDTKLKQGTIAEIEDLLKENE